MALYSTVCIHVCIRKLSSNNVSIHKKENTKGMADYIYISITLSEMGETSCFMAWISATHVLIVVLLHIGKTFVKVHKTAVY